MIFDSRAILHSYRLKNTLSVLVYFICVTCYSQQIHPGITNKNKTVSRSGSGILPFSLKTHSTEVCDNNIDDDSNGLIDYKDFGCYYNSKTHGCLSTKIIWACSNWGLQWADPETGEERLVGNLDGRVMNDLTWTVHSTLYGIDRLYDTIYQINPYTSATTAAAVLTGYYSANAMTSDRDGNLYMAAIKTNQHWDVIKLDMLTSKITVVANLSAKGLESGGDMVFLDGYLYLTCTNMKIARINISDKSIEVYSMLNSPVTGSMGMITLGDGYLYICSISEIYRVDPATMLVEDTPYYSFSYPSTYLFGLSNYTEYCNAPGCNGKVSISNLSSQPFCSNSGVLLKGTGEGVVGDPLYEWTLPDGSIKISDSLKATQNGLYNLRYRSQLADCEVKDSIELYLIKQPMANLGNDTIICDQKPINLQPKDIQDIDFYFWQDGSNSSSLSATQPGKYWLGVSNACGNSFDTIIVISGHFPKVDLGKDTSICPGSMINIKNNYNKEEWDKYYWPDGSDGDSIRVNAKGTYWLQSQNACGIWRDSIQVLFRDSCICFPFYPSVDLGSDVSICPYNFFTIKNNDHQEGYRYNWIDGTTGENLKVNKAGLYWVGVSTYCGTVWDSLIVLEKSEGCIRKLYVPSAFTPNRDGKNDILKPIFLGSESLKLCKFYIYNRWGELVFLTSDPNKGWDGSLKGQNQDNNIFVWLCTYQFEGEPEKSEKGIITLIK